jgi:hypothetical protein
LRRLSFDRRAFNFAQETKELDLVFFLAFGTEEDAGLRIVTSYHPINILYCFSTGALKFLWSQTQDRMPRLLLYLYGAIKLDTIPSVFAEHPCFGAAYC